MHLGSWESCRWLHEWLHAAGRGGRPVVDRPLWTETPVSGLRLRVAAYSLRESVWSGSHVQLGKGKDV